jgi:hypothetical protein
MDSVRKKYTLIHGLLKSGFINLVNIIHAKIPKKYLVTEVKDVKNTPEIANLIEAFDLGLADFVKHNSPGYEQSKAFKTLTKMKELAITMAANDTAYYVFLEYILKHYCVIKFGSEALEKFDEQWLKRLESLMK